MKISKTIPVLLLTAVFLFSCGGSKGDFAFKHSFDEAYRKAQGVPEFKSLDEIHWVYSFKGSAGRQNISVIIQKKEITWVETAAYSDYVGEEKTIIQGTIHNYPPGNYRISLINSIRNEPIDEVEFIVYSDNEDD